jgi:hypothetical protein
MGLFDSFFGPSWADRVAVYMQDTRLPLIDRIRLCIKHLMPTVTPREAAEGIPITEIKKYLSVLHNGEELLSVCMAMQLRQVTRMPVAVMKGKEQSKWCVTPITGTLSLPPDDELRYRRSENDRIVIWHPVDSYGQDLIRL